MKKMIFTTFIFCMFLLPSLPVQAKERTFTNVGKSEIISEGLYFRVCEINTAKNTITITVQAKNKSILSQAVYVELLDDTSIFPPEKPSSMVIFNPLKFNKTVTEKLTFNVKDANKNYNLALYSRDIFKKDKKQIITKMSIKDIKAELEKGKVRTLF